MSKSEEAREWEEHHEKRVDFVAVWTKSREANMVPKTNRIVVAGSEYEGHPEIDVPYVRLELWGHEFILTLDQARRFRHALNIVMDDLVRGED